MSMVLPILCIVTIGAMLVFGLTRYYPVSTGPQTIVPLQWLFILILATLSPWGTTPISDETYVLVTLSVCAFCTCFMVGRTANRRLLENSSALIVHPTRRKLLFFAAIIFLPLFLIKAQSLATNGPTENSLINIRYAVSEDDQSGYGFAKYLVVIAFSSLLVERLARHAGKWGVRYATIFTTAFIYATLTLSRTNILLFLIIAFWPLDRTSPGRFIRFLAVGALIGILFFVAVGIMLNKGGNSEADLSENLLSLLESFKLYLSGGLFAMNHLVSHFNQYQEGTNTLGFFYKLFNLSSSATAPLGDGWICLPECTNVYTVLAFPYIDFGSTYTVLYMAVGGLASGIIYSYSLGGGYLEKSLYLLSIYPAALQFFGDQYLAVLSLWIQFLIVLILIKDRRPGSISKDTGLTV